MTAHATEIGVSSCIEYLRQSTKPYHEALESLKTSRDIVRGVIPVATYLELLSHLYYAHRIWEILGQKTLAQHSRPWPRLSFRAAAIVCDLSALGGSLKRCPGSVIQWCKKLRVEGSPWVWAGAGYVLEGSRLGARAIVPGLKRALHVPSACTWGLSYHLDQSEVLQQYWCKVVTYLNDLGTSASVTESIVYGAILTFKCVTSIYEGVT